MGFGLGRRGGKQDGNSDDGAKKICVRGSGLTCAVHVVHLGVAKEPLVSEVSLCGGETRLALVNRLQHTPVSAQVSSPALASCHDGASPQSPEGEREREGGGETKSTNS